MASKKRARIDLGKHVLDKTVLDRADRYVGKVDDLVLEVEDGSTDGGSALPEVVAVVCGPTALARRLPGPCLALARAVYRLLGLDDPGPVEISWESVNALDVVVHADVDRREVGAMALEDAVDRTIISRLPGAGVRP